MDGRKPPSHPNYDKSKDKNQKAKAPDHGLEYWPAASISAEKNSYRRQSPSARSRSGSHAWAFQIQTTEAEEKVANHFSDCGDSGGRGKLISTQDL